MSIPDYQACMLPLLQYLGDGKEHPMRDAVDHVSDVFELSEEERRQRIPSGHSRVISNRVGWARTYLHKAGLVQSPRRGIWQLSQQGARVLSSNPPRIDSKFLEQFPSFIEFRPKSKVVQPPPTGTTDGSESTPEEALQAAWTELQSGLQDELLESVKSNSPAFFEQLVVDLIVKMGYGGNREDAGQAMGKSGDGGIDGVIKEDRLGLDAIYVQAKKWDSTVGRPEIQKFAGALQGVRARKGVFLTTGIFSKEALGYTEQIEAKIVLIDGRELAKLMVEHGIGVSVVDRYEVKRLDTDYFDAD